MSKMTASVPHQLTRAEAKRRIQEQIGVLRKQHAASIANVQETWVGDHLDFSVTAMTQTVSGHLNIDDQMVHVEVTLPWMLSLLAGPVKQRLEQQARHLLSGPAKETASPGKNAN